MTTETTQPTTDDVDAILARVELSRDSETPDLTPAQRSEVEAVAKHAYFRARADGASVEQARSAAVNAAGLLACLDDLPARAAEYASARAAVNALPKPAEMPTQSTHAGSEAAGVDAVGLARSERDRAAAIAAGWAPADTVYTRGLRVIEAGVEAARQSREEYDRKPLVSELCADFVGRIAGEERRDIIVPAAAIRMASDGSISALPGRADIEDAAIQGFDGTLEADAFPALCSRMGFASGARYLRDRCSPELRAHNVNAQAVALNAREAKAAAAERDNAKREGRAPAAVASLISLRTRRAPNDARSVYAVTSPTYAPFDADKVAEAIARSTPNDARGSVAYDGRRTRFEVLFTSNVQPRHYVAGEFFKAGVIVTTDDTGAGGIRARAVVWQNLCLNLAIIDEASRSLLHLIHVGNVSELARKFAAGYRAALDSLEHFLKVWGYACEEDVAIGARRVSDTSVPDQPRELVEGVFAGLISGGARARLKLPRPKGKKLSDLVDELVQCWERDESGARSVHATSRAAIVNAITRWAHELVEQIDDPWAEDEISRQACALLWAPRGAKSPKALEWVDRATLAKEPDADTATVDDAPLSAGASS